MNNKKAIVAILAVLALSMIPLMAIESDESDAIIVIEGVTQGTVTSSNGGDILVHFNSEEVRDRTITITVTLPENDNKVIGTATVEIPAETEYTAAVHISGLGVGTYNVKITCEDSVYFGINTQSFVLDVTKSIWSNVSTYLAIAVVAILIVVAAVIKMRSAPKVKPDTTFTELEKQNSNESRKSQKTVDPEPTTERKRYDKTEKRAETPKPKEPVKATTFTELEKEQKTSIREKPADEKSDSSEPKKLKYVSSRRK